MPDGMSEIMEYDSKRSLLITGEQIPTHREIDDYRSYGINKVNSNDLQKIKQKSKILKTKILTLFVNICWNVFALLIFVCVFLLIYDSVGMTFLDTYFDSIKISAIEYLSGLDNFKP